MRCAQCGTDNHTGQIYCQTCGVELDLTYDQVHDSIQEKLIQEKEQYTEEQTRQFLVLGLFLMLLAIAFSAFVPTVPTDPTPTMMPDDVDLRTHPCPIEEAPETVWEADVLAIAVDDNAARYQINVGVLGRGGGRGIVDAALGRTFCQVRTLEPPSTACLVCLWSAEYAERLFAEILREACDEFFERSVEAFPALGVLSSIAGSLAATRVLGLLSEPEAAFSSPAGRAIRFDLARMETTEGEVLRNPQCVEILCRRRRKSCES